MPRLFTGLQIPQLQRTQLSLLQSGLQNVRWIEPSDMHITLRFIGDVSPSLAEEIAESLSSRSWCAPQVVLGELAAFGSKKPKSVHASVRLNQELSGLAAGHERLMQQIGLEPDGRKFTPHVTLARCRQVAIPKLAQWLASNGGFVSSPFTPDRFVLYSARESTGGGPYVIERSWPLTSKAEPAPPAT